MQLPLPGEKKLRMQGPFIPLRKKKLPSIKKTFEFFLLIQKKKCNFALNETKKSNNNN